MVQRMINNAVFNAYLSFRGVKNFPKCLYIETTNACNLNCVICPRQNMKREIGFMNFSLYTKIIREAAENGIREVVLHVFGEPLIYSRELFKMIEYAKEKKMKVHFSTNCLLLSRDNTKKILNSRLDSITLSLDGLKPSTYSKIRRNSNYQKVVKNIEYFLKEKNRLDKKSPSVNLQIIKTKETLRELSGFKKRWSQFLGNNDKIVVKEYTTFAGQARDWSIKSLKRSLKHSLKKLFPCRMLWTDLVVLWNGDVVACCLDIDGRMKLGNCKKQSLKEIVNGKPLNAIKKMYLNGKIDNLPLCISCRK